VRFTKYTELTALYHLEAGLNEGTFTRNKKLHNPKGAELLVIKKQQPYVETEGTELMNGL
jgi:hypothetical protein